MIKIAKKKGILSYKQRTQGWWPSIYSIKYADIKAIKLIKNIAANKFFLLRLNIEFVK